MSAKTEAMNRIDKALGRISELNRLTWESPEFLMWKRNTKLAIANIFTTKSGHVKEFEDIDFSSPFIGATESREIEACASGLDKAAALLISMREEIEEYWPDDSPAQPVSQSQETPEPHLSNRVFVVHGRDGGTRDTVARFLETLELEAVILQEQASEGRTIIEKFEDHSGVGFAVVLCTPDDIGALATESDKLKPRPRQNVILELGFFWGRLGRKKVCALLEGDMEMPSDYDGVLYIPLDVSEGWKLTLARELRAAGMTIDLNLLAKR